jgi:hypothetical protein
MEEENPTYFGWNWTKCQDKYLGLRDDVTGKWGILRNEEVHVVYSWAVHDWVKYDEIGGICLSQKKVRNKYKSLILQPPLGATT